MKKILITGANSYIGTNVENWLSKGNDKYEINTIDLIDGSWVKEDFSKYDVIFHVAGIAHADTGNVNEETKQLYYKVNRDLCLEVANKAKSEGVKQFIFMSSMIVYSAYKGKITKDTPLKAYNFYGDSKLQADLKLQELNDSSFKVVILRPPMIYGYKSKGNYPRLAKLAVKTLIFPKVNNTRSMLHIDNLCEFIKLMIDNEEQGVFFPQNKEYVNTSDMVKIIADVKKHKIVLIPFNIIRLFNNIPGKIGNVFSKVFGDSYYDLSMSEYKENYRINDFYTSIIKTEGEINE